MLDEWFWAIFKLISTLHNFVFGQLSVARKPIINDGAIRLTGLLFLITVGLCEILLNLSKSWPSLNLLFIPLHTHVICPPHSWQVRPGTPCITGAARNTMGHHVSLERPGLIWFDWMFYDHFSARSLLAKLGRWGWWWAWWGWLERKARRH